MKDIKQISLIVTVSAIVSFVVFGLFLVMTQDEASVVGFGANNSQYSLIDSNDASSTAAVTVKSVPGVLTSITVGSQASTTVTTSIGIHDSSNGTSSATLIGTLETGIGVGTYTFNVETIDGLTLDVPASFDGVYTISYK